MIICIHFGQSFLALLRPKRISSNPLARFQLSPEISGPKDASAARLLGRRSVKGA